MKITKNKLAAAVVLSLLAGGMYQNAQADSGYENVQTIQDEGTYNFKAGNFNDQLMEIEGDKSKGGTITLNVENNGTLNINKLGQYPIIDVCDNNSSPDINAKRSDITINGSLNLVVDCGNDARRNNPKAINLFNNNDTLTINGDVAIKVDRVNTSSPNYWADGIMVYSGSATINGNLVVDGINAASTNGNGEYYEATGVYSTTIGDREGAYVNGFTSHIVLGSASNNEIKIKNVHAASEAGYTSAIGIVSEGDHSVVDVNGKAEITDINAKSNNGHAESIALFANNHGIININDDLSIDNIEGKGTTNEVVALQVDKGGIINVNEAQNANRMIKIVGDIDGGDRDAGDHITLNLLNKNSSLTGASMGNVDMQLSNGATWHVKNRHLVNDATYDADSKDSYVHSLSGTGGILQIDMDASKNSGNNTVSIEEHSGEHFINLLNVNASHITTGANGTVLVNVVQENGLFKVQSSENGLYWQTYELDRKEDNGLTEWYLKEAKKQEENNEAKPTTSVSTLLSTVTAGYDTWRNDADKLNERMGELRLNGKGHDGVWVRMKGSEFGRHGSNGAYTNKQYTYQLGYDVASTTQDAQTTYTGIAAEYGKGNLSFEHGTGTMKSFGLGLYQTKIRESGHYLDFICKYDTYKNDFHVADTAGNPISGKYSNHAMSMSAEYGRQSKLNHGWYIEPQGELTVGYMWGNDFVTSNHIRVEQKNMPALIGRLGVNIGRNIGDKATFYVKASVNHDFLGEYDVHMTDMTTGDRLDASDRFGSSWFDYGAGFSVKAAKNCYAYFDIERAVGGEYKKNWDWNAGIRWNF